MHVIGIHDGHNASVAMLSDGRLCYALSEERLSRVKNQGGIPAAALRRMLADMQLDPGQIDKLVISGTTPPRREWIEKELILQRYREQVEAGGKKTPRLRRVIDRLLGDAIGGRRSKAADDARQARHRALLALGFEDGQLEYIDHHLCHASASYYGGGMSDAPTLVISNDGGGDGLCATVSLAQGREIRRLAEVRQGHSFATLYSRATFLLGMVPLEHEYKVMGMAPYGDSGRAAGLLDELLAMFEWDAADPYRWRRRSGLPPTYQWGRTLEEMFRFRRFDDISLALQLFVEHMALRWIRNCLQATGARRVALGGGLFMNVKLNKLVLELPEVDELFVMPSCSDESNSIGAALWGAVQYDTGHPVAGLRDLYLGAVYPAERMDEAVRAFAAEHRVSVSVRRSDAIADDVAALLADGEIVARYAGREEFGARALGNRSILSDPARLENVVAINKMIKQRDFWMPFAGSMTEDQARRNLDNPKGHFAPYMVTTFDPAVDRAPFRAATHPQDGTIRPQMLREDWNPDYHAIIRRFAARTGRDGGLLNTSFNLHGYPIVSSPEDALSVFERSGLRNLALGPYLLRKVDPD